MNQKETEQRNVTIYWWNGGVKTLDFKGNPMDFLKEKGLKSIREIKHPTVKGVKGNRFRMYFGSNIITIDMFDGDFANDVSLIIVMYLAYLGDRTIFYDVYGREHKIHWK